MPPPIPTSREAEIVEFGLLRPGVIKVMSFHNPDGLRRLAANHPQAQWIVRAFLDFGNRSLNPQGFFNDTINDMNRTMSILQGRDVVIELHNEPNLYAEGLAHPGAMAPNLPNGGCDCSNCSAMPFLTRASSSRVCRLDQMRAASVRIMSVSSKASRTAVAAADGLGIHLYWSKYYPLPRSLDVLDDYVKRFP